MTNRLTNRILLTVLVACFGAAWTTSAMATDYRLRLSAGERLVSPESTEEFFRASESSPYTERGAVIQFYQLPDEFTRQTLAALGIRLYEYLPDMAFLATIPTSVQESDLAGAGIRWVGVLQAEEKVAKILLIDGTPEWSRDAEGIPRFSVKMYGHVSLEEAAQWLTAEYGGVILSSSTLAHAVDVGLPAENWYDLAGDERVQWIEPFWPHRTCNNSNRVNTEAEVVQAPPYSLDGAGVVVGEWDAGSVDNSHTDFDTRVVKGDGSPNHYHATHVAGTVLGSGAQSGGTYRGMAPGASMVSYLWWSSSSSLETEYQTAIDVYGMDITTNSWIVGYAPTSIEQCEAFLGNYFASCATLDDIICGSLGKTVAISWAAGNERSTGSDYCGKFGMTWGTVAPYGTAKNTITVGAINSNNSTMTSFSSWGPVDDGRIKPELVAPGCQSSGDYGVTSTRIGGGYFSACGTSMAAPTVAGCVSLWLDAYKTLYPGQVPLASTIKAAFINSADDLGDPGPEFDFGWGKINVAAAVDIVNGAAFFEDYITDGDTLTWVFAFDGTLPELTFTLAWDDPGAAEMADPTLVNDLDLRIQTPAPFPATFRPWTVDAADPAANANIGEDHTNNVEQVERDVEIFGPGTWTLMVIGYNVPDGPQSFSVAHNPGMVMTPEQVDYAAVFVAGEDVAIIPGEHPIQYYIFNTGRQEDTYDVTLTSARGWDLDPNPTSVTVAGRDDSAVVFMHTIPVGTTPGLADTIVATFVSQADPGITGADTLVVEVIAGYGVAIAALADTAAVPSREITFDAVITNLGTQADLIDWSVADDLGWTITPLGGTVSLPLTGDTTLTITVTVDPGTLPGSINNIVVSAVSQGDPEAADQNTTQIEVIEFPPMPSLVSLINGELTNNNTPELVWSPGSYTPPPPDFDVFTYSLEIGGDTTLTTGVERYDGLTDTVYTPADPLADGVYFWRVLTYNAAGDSSGFPPSARFDVDVTRPEPPILLSPPTLGAGSDRTPLFEWGEVTAKQGTGAGVMNYLWEISDDSTFATVTWYWNTPNLYYQLPITRELPPCSAVVFWRVTATDPAGNVSDPGGPSRYQVYTAGDVNFDCAVDALDLSGIIDYIFAGVDPPYPADRAEMNCIPGVDALDLSYLIDYLFSGGPAPCEEE